MSRRVAPPRLVLLLARQKVARQSPDRVAVLAPEVATSECQRRFRYGLPPAGRPAEARPSAMSRAADDQEHDFAAVACLRLRPLRSSW